MNDFIQLSMANKAAKESGSYLAKVFDMVTNPRCAPCGDTEIGSIPRPEEMSDQQLEDWKNRQAEIAQSF